MYARGSLHDWASSHPSITTCAGCAQRIRIATRNEGRLSVASNLQLPGGRNRLQTLLPRDTNTLTSPDRDSNQIRSAIMRGDSVPDD